MDISFRNAAKALYFLYLVKISHVYIWNWIQKYKPNKMSSKKKKNIDEYLCIQKDETDVKGGSELIWL
jgi:putative transposase